jgi:hypothetical protein
MINAKQLPLHLSAGLDLNLMNIGQIGNQIEKLVSIGCKYQGAGKGNKSVTFNIQES